MRFKFWKKRPRPIRFSDEEKALIIELIKEDALRILREEERFTPIHGDILEKFLPFNVTLKEEKEMADLYWRIMRK